MCGQSQLLHRGERVIIIAPPVQLSDGGLRRYLPGTHCTVLGDATTPILHDDAVKSRRDGDTSPHALF